MMDLRFKFLNVERRSRLPKKTTNWFTSILMGMALQRMDPMLGPVLASILMYASAANTVSQGSTTLIYSIGMAIPLY